MPRLNADITLYPLDAGGEVAPDPVRFDADDYDYLSFINAGTYGIPPLVTKTTDKNGEKPPVAVEGDVVLYVNPGAILAMKVEKRES